MVIRPRVIEDFGLQTRISQEVDAGPTVPSGAVVYAEVGIGADTRLGHHLTVEREARIGRDVCCSPGSHITCSSVLADRVFLGAGVRTINDKTLAWRDPHRAPTLAAPRFDTGAKVGGGCVLLASVTVGEHALVGAGSLATRPRRHTVARRCRPSSVSGASRASWLAGADVAIHTEPGGCAARKGHRRSEQWCSPSCEHARVS